MHCTNDIKFTRENIAEHIVNIFPELQKNFQDSLIDFEEDNIGTPSDEEIWGKDNSRKNFREPKFCTKLLSLDRAIYALIKNKNLSNERIKKIFELIERILETNQIDTVLKEFEICFFEGLTSSLYYNDLLTAEFIGFLGPISKSLCEKNDTFWGSNIMRISQKKKKLESKKD